MVQRGGGGRQKKGGGEKNVLPTGEFQEKGKKEGEYRKRNENGGRLALIREGGKEESSGDGRGSGSNRNISFLPALPLSDKNEKGKSAPT